MSRTRVRKDMSRRRRSPGFASSRAPGGQTAVRGSSWEDTTHGPAAPRGPHARKRAGARHCDPLHRGLRHSHVVHGIGGSSARHDAPRSMPTPFARAREAVLHFSALALAVGCVDHRGRPSIAPPPAAPAPSTPNPPVGVAPSRVETRKFESAALGVEKRYVVYLPRGYDDSEHSFPVVFLLHGLGGNETNWTAQGHLSEAADATGLEAVVVMPDGDDGFYVNGATPSDYPACLKSRPPWTPSEEPATYCVRSPRYEDYVVRDLLSDVEKTYRTLRDRRSRGIGGLSMGGFGALSLAMRHPSVFSAAASHSGMVALLYGGPHPYVAGAVNITHSPVSFGAQYPKKFRTHLRAIFGGDIENWLAHDPAALATKLLPGSLSVYLDCGSSDDFHFEDHASYVNDVLAASGVRHELAFVRGAHDWKVWRATLPGGLRFFESTLAQ